MYGLLLFSSLVRIYLSSFLFLVFTFFFFLHVFFTSRTVLGFLYEPPTWAWGG